MMDYHYYLVLGALLFCALLYGLWKLLIRVNRGGFIIPARSAQPTADDAPDDFMCILTREPRARVTDTL